MEILNQSFKQTYESLLRAAEEGGESLFPYRPDLYAFIVVSPSEIGLVGGIQAFPELHVLSGEDVAVIAPYFSICNGRQGCAMLQALHQGRPDPHVKRELKRTFEILGSQSPFAEESQRDSFNIEWHQNNVDFLKMLQVPSSAMPCIVVTDGLKENLRVAYLPRVANLVQSFRELCDLTRADPALRSELRQIESDIQKTAQKLERSREEEIAESPKSPLHRGLRYLDKVRSEHARALANHTQKRNGALRAFRKWAGWLERNTPSTADPVLHEKLHYLHTASNNAARAEDIAALTEHYSMLKGLRKGRLRDCCDPFDLRNFDAEYSILNQAWESFIATRETLERTIVKLHEVEAKTAQELASFEQNELAEIQRQRSAELEKLKEHRRDLRSKFKSRSPFDFLLSQSNWQTTRRSNPSTAKASEPGAITDVVFIHGLGGSPEGTWGRFPELIAEDKSIKVNTHLFKYRTHLFGFSWPFQGVKVQRVAEQLDTYIRLSIKPLGRVAIVAHSLGGLVARHHVMNLIRKGKKGELPKLLLYATPNNGADIAKLVSFISRSFQIAQLRPDSDFIESLNEAWSHEKVDEAVDLTMVYAVLDEVVTRESFRLQWGDKRIETVDGNHLSCVKPTDHKHMSYLIFQGFVQGGAEGMQIKD